LAHVISAVPTARSQFKHGRWTPGRLLSHYLLLCPL
jgi:hypothetical protein